MKFRAKTLLAFAGLLSVSFFSKSILASDDVYDASCFVNGRTVTLDYNGESFPSNSVLPLKDVLLRRCPRLQPLDLQRLGSVTLVAKAKSDYASASLMVGNYQTPSYSMTDDYQSLYLQAPTGQRHFDSWMLNFTGKVKVERVQVQLDGHVGRAPVPPVVRRAPLPPVVRRVPLPPVVRRGPVVVRRGPVVVRRPGRVVNPVRRVVRHVERAVRRVHRRVGHHPHGRGHRPCGRRR